MSPKVRIVTLGLRNPNPNPKTKANMPFRRAQKSKKTSKKRVVRRPRQRIARPIRGMNDHGQMARIKETFQFVNINPNISYNFNFHLDEFQRASSIAPMFKWYKATLVEWTVDPLYNTFQDGTTGGEVTIPYLYMTMNRTQDTTGINIGDIKAIGAKPQKLVGTRRISYRPNWCSPGLSAYLIGAQYASVGLQPQYGWLACPNTLPAPGAMTPATATGQTPTAASVYTSTVIYNGHTVIADQEVPTGTLQPVARVTVTVHWAFKDPHYTQSPDGMTVQPK